MSFGYELISETDRLEEFLELGRIVPEILPIHGRSEVGKTDDLTLKPWT